jgi:hypothetical protein
MTNIPQSMLHFKLLDERKTWMTPYQEVQLSKSPPWDQMMHLRSEHGIEGPRRVDKQVDVLSTVKTTVSSAININQCFDRGSTTPLPVCYITRSNNYINI